MKKLMLWVLAATLICGVMPFATSCKDANKQENTPAKEVQSTELIRTSQSWDGVASNSPTTSRAAPSSSP